MALMRRTPLHGVHRQRRLVAVELRGVEPTLRQISITVSGRSLTKTPTVVSSGGRTATIAFARSGRM